MPLSERLMHASSVRMWLTTDRWAQAEDVAIADTCITTDDVTRRLSFQLLLFRRRPAGQVSLVAGPRPMVLLSGVFSSLPASLV